MSLLNQISDRVKAFYSPEARVEELNLDPQMLDPATPTFWLLGKTGAGKSSLIRALTGKSAIEIGNGFQPCTMSSDFYPHPEAQPLLRFLDTRGLAEAGYDPSEDIAFCSQRRHALIIVVRIDEPEQSALLRALKRLRQENAIHQPLVVHTACQQLDETKRAQAINYQQQQIETALGMTVEAVAVDFELDDGGMFGVDELQNKLSARLPILAELLTEAQHSDQEEALFAQRKREILWYASTAGAADVVPLLGLAAVPAIQGKLLHALANHYQVEWNQRALMEIVAAMGGGFALQYLSKLGVRQLVKLIPGYGQVVGSLTAAAVSFGSTYAIGRVACKFMYHKQRGETVSSAEMQELYRNAFASVKELASNETSH